jgi:hypothetical protein
VNQRFGGTYQTHLLGRKSAEQEISFQQVARQNTAGWFLARLIFGLEDGFDTFLRNVGSYTDYTAPYHNNYRC